MDDTNTNTDCYRIDDLVVDPGARRVTRGGENIRLPKLSFDLFLALLDAAPNVVSTDNLIKAVWGDVVVSDETVTQRVKMLRDVLDRGGDKQHYIETIRSVGYRLRAPVTAITANNASAATAIRWRWAIAAFVLLVVATLLLTGRDGILLQEQPGRPMQASIAVLPFVAMSDGADDGYFADGVTEEVLNALAQVPDLLVTARTSAFYFKGRNLPVQEIAASLGVANILEGSVRRDADQLRITVQLVRADDGFHIWSEAFDHASDDIFAVQTAIAENVAAALEVVLDDELRTRMENAGVRDPNAFVAYQKGLALFEAAHGTNQGIGLLARANDHFDDAIRQSEEFSEAYVKRADYLMHVLLSIASGVALEGYTSEDIAAVGESVLADLDAAIRVAGNPKRRRMVAFDRAILTGEWRGMKHQIKAIVEAPACVSSPWMETVALPFGYASDLLPLVERWVDCDPLNFEAHIHRIRALLWLGDFAATHQAATAALQRMDHPLLRISQVVALASMGKPEPAREIIESRPDDVVLQIGGEFWLGVLQGDAERGREYMARSEGVFAITPGDRMAYLAMLGDKQAVNRIAASADANRFGHMALISALLTCYCGAVFDLEVTPNFARLVEESGMPWPPSRPIEFPLKTW